MSSRHSTQSNAEDKIKQEEIDVLKLAQEEGVPLISFLLSKAIDDESLIPDNIREWTF